MRLFLDLHVMYDTTEDFVEALRDVTHCYIHHCMCENLILFASL